MSGPRHLWSGDWRNESSAHAEALEARRVPGEAPAEAERVVPPRRVPPRRVPLWRQASRTLLAQLRSMRLGGRDRLRAAGLIVSLTLLSAGAAYVVTSLVVRAMGGA